MNPMASSTWRGTVSPPASLTTNAAPLCSYSRFDNRPLFSPRRQTLYGVSGLVLIACSTSKSVPTTLRTHPGMLRLTVELNRPHDFVEIVFDAHGPVGEGRAADAPFAEDAVELVLVGGVVGDRRGGVLQLMAGEDTD